MIDDPDHPALVEKDLQASTWRLIFVTHLIAAVGLAAILLGSWP